MGVRESNVKNELTPEDKCMSLFCKNMHDSAQKMTENREMQAKHQDVS